MAPARRFARTPRHAGTPAAVSCVSPAADATMKCGAGRLLTVFPDRSVALPAAVSSGVFWVVPRPGHSQREVWPLSSMPMIKRRDVCMHMCIWECCDVVAYCSCSPGAAKPARLMVANGARDVMRVRPAATLPFAVATRGRDVRRACNLSTGGAAASSDQSPRSNCSTRQCTSRRRAEAAISRQRSYLKDFVHISKQAICELRR